MDADHIIQSDAKTERARYDGFRGFLLGRDPTRRLADAFARHDVSIRAARQETRGDDAQLIIVSHQARDAALAATVSELESLDAVRAVASVMRVEGEEGSP